jgi:cytochrome c peroxidase
MAWKPSTKAIVIWICGLLYGSMCTLLVSAQEDNTRLGLPTVAGGVTSEYSAAKVLLGKKLFFDKRLSYDGTISCASCHQPERLFSDGLALAKGIKQRLGTRNTPSLLNVAFNESQFWDGRRSDLESQALDPFVNPREHGLLDEIALIDILRRDREYLLYFQNAFQDSRNAINLINVARALADFERTLLAGNSPFDRYSFKGEIAALSPAAVRGLALFREGARCMTCHTIEKTHALFSDNQFHSVSVGLHRLSPALSRITTRLVRSKEGGVNLDKTVLGDEDIAELGRFSVTFNPADIAKFRTPSLRNVAETAPYMHDGSVATLEEAVELELYYRNTQAAKPLVLTPGERADLVEFLKSLSSPPFVSTPP